MAASQLKTKHGKWIIDPKIQNIIGKGTFGIVYRATNHKGNKVAAKLVDTKQKNKLSQITSHLKKLVELDHRYILKVFDVYQEEHNIWMIMKVCKYGNLTMLCTKKSMNQEERIHVMLQMASGIKYLHEQSLIHGNLKPENILVACDSPVRVKLTDCDVSSFLENFCPNSAVGSLAFNAPEYFRKTADGPVIESPGVDSYSAGLVFLAMAQQQDGRKHLFPQIETPREESELHVPSVGQLIAERIKYNIPNLNIVVTSHVSNDTTASGGAEINLSYDRTNEVKQLIQNMTRANPEDRWSAAQVFECLAEIKLKLIQAKRREIQAKEKEAAEQNRGKARGYFVDKCNITAEKPLFVRNERFKNRTSSNPTLIAADISRTWECKHCKYLANNECKEICDNCGKSKDRLLCQGCLHDNPVGSRICEACMQVLKEPPRFLW